MASHVWDRNMGPRCTGVVIDLYEKARELGVEEGDAKQLAGWIHERKSQGSQILRGGAYFDIEDGESKFLEKVIKRCWAWKGVDYRHLRPWFDKHYTKALRWNRIICRNMRVVLGPDAETDKEGTWYLMDDWPMWLKVRRGRDLFLKGLGTFPIPQGRALDPMYLMCEGYFPEVQQYYHARELLREWFGGRGRYKLEYLVRYRGWFRENHTRLDELYHMACTPDVHPQDCRRVHAPRMHGGEFTFCEDFDPEDRYPKDWTTDYGTHHMLRSTKELVQASEDFHNCALDYNDSLIPGKGVVDTRIAVCYDTEGKALAMTEYVGVEISQCVAVCNQPITDTALIDECAKFNCPILSSIRREMV